MLPFWEVLYRHRSRAFCETLQTCSSLRRNNVFQQAEVGIELIRVSAAAVDRVPKVVHDLLASDAVSLRLVVHLRRFERSSKFRLHIFTLVPHVDVQQDLSEVSIIL